MVYFKYYCLKNILCPKNVRVLRRQRLRLTKAAGSIQVGKKTRSTLTVGAKQQPGRDSRSPGPPACLHAGHACLSNCPRFCDHRHHDFGRSVGESQHFQPELLGPGPCFQDSGQALGHAFRTAVCSSPWFPSTEARTGERGGSVPGFSSRRSCPVRAFLTTEPQKTKTPTQTSYLLQ